MKNTFGTLLVIASMVAPGCTTAVGPDGSEPGLGEESLVHVRIAGPDGELSEHDVDRSSFLGALAPLPAYLADGEESTDPGRVLTADRSELALATGEILVIQHEGNVLSRLEPAQIEGVPNVTVELTPAMDELYVTGDEGTTVIEIDGDLDEATRAQVAGTLAVGLLGGHAGLDGQIETPQCEFFCFATIVAVTVAMSYVTCVTVGQAICGDIAVRACRRGVRNSAMICGAGFDAQGSFRLGFECTYVCR